MEHSKYMFHRLKGQCQIQEELEAAKPIAKLASGEDEQRRTLKDYVTLGVQNLTPSITEPAVVINNFELNPTLISIV